MTTIALIHEGATDMAVIENICIGLFGETIIINPVQPEYCLGNQSTPGGWSNVVAFLKDSEKMQTALSLNNYLIVHIDADAVHNLPHPINSTDFDLISDNGVANFTLAVAMSISSIIPNSLITMNYKKLILSIPVKKTECWIIPLHTRDSTLVSRVSSCDNSLPAVLPKKHTLLKSYPCYLGISRKFTKKKQLLLACRHQKSLEIFVNSLQNTIK